MRMKMFKYSILIITLIVIYCKENLNLVEYKFDYANLINSWKNSFEEQITNDPTQIFRPSNYKEFPRSRYREELVFNQDNSCRYLVLSPLDAHHFKKGIWEFVDQKKNILQILDSAGTVYKKFKIIELNDDLLKFIIVN